MRPLQSLLTALLLAGVQATSAVAGSIPDLSVTATVAPSTRLQPGSYGTIRLEVENVGGAATTSTTFSFRHDAEQAAGRFLLIRTTPPCAGATFYGDGLPGVPDVTGLLGSFGGLAPGQTATCTAEFQVDPAATGSLVVRVAGNAAGETNYSNNVTFVRLVFGGVLAPVLEVPRIVPMWNAPVAALTIVLFLLAAGASLPGRRRDL
jgi:hypothetical protein